MRHRSLLRSLAGAGALALGAGFAACSSGGETIDPLPPGDDAGVESGGGSGGGGGGAGGNPGDASPDAEIPVNGALVQVTMESEVAVLLDELPPAMRDRVADQVLAAPASFWEDRARRQLRLTGVWGQVEEALPPLPPEAVWTVTLAPEGAMRTTIDGHDSVSVHYAFSTTLLSDRESPHQIGDDAELRHVAGVFEKLYRLPSDPDQIYQRLDGSCASQGQPLPFPYCPQAVEDAIGRSDATMRFERLSWDADVAASARVGEVVHAAGPELEVLGGNLERSRLVYAYVPADSCAIVEGCVGGPGWRRLLQFTATLRNNGGSAMHIGDPLTSSLLEHNVFEYSACHEHMHFSHYGDFRFGDAAGEKKAFCLISTSRYANNETTPLVTPYRSCAHQGISAGWGDDYAIGLDCQWIDVTDVDVSAGPVSSPLEFAANPDAFLCEGTPVLDERGEQVYEPTEFIAADGSPVDRPACDFFPGWDQNNSQSRDVTIPVSGSYVTRACAGLQLGPTRDCGFLEQETALTCAPGASVSLSCAIGFTEFPQVVRICETSAVLGTGLACSFLSSPATATVAEGPTTVTFECPAPRDPSEPGGGYAVYVAPLYAGDPVQTVTCTVQPP